MLKRRLSKNKTCFSPLLLNNSSFHSKRNLYIYQIGLSPVWPVLVAAYKVTYSSETIKLNYIITYVTLL